MDTPPLVDAIQTLQVPDSFKPRFNAEQWRVFATYLLRHEVPAGQEVIRQGDLERCMYLVERGAITVFTTGARAAQGQKLAILRAGAIVGEPAMFGEHPRMANVETMTPSVLWELSALRLDEMMASKPALAMELLRALGAVMAERMRMNLETGQPMT